MAIGSGLFGFIIATTVKSDKKVDRTMKQPIVFDRFFLQKGIGAGFSLFLLAIPYGMLTTYVAIYGRELGIKSGMGIFFSMMAAGLIVSRLFAGKLVDRGKLIQVITTGIAVCLLALFTLSGLNRLIAYDKLVMILFFVVAVVLGVGYGMLFPAYNTLFVNLAPNNRRATANSTYLTSWDLGIGLGLMLGGHLADTNGGLSLAFLVGALTVSLSFVFFTRVAGPHFNKNKLR